MFLPILFFLIGFVILIKGADWLVEGGSSLARKYGFSELAIGLTVVAFGTSMPELVVNSVAAFQGHSDIVFGNVIGSNNFNLLAILGIAGLITPLVVQSGTVWKEIPLSLGAAAILFLLANNFLGGETILSRIDGIILLAAFIFFLLYVYKQMRTEITESDATKKTISAKKTWLFILLGLICLVAGGRLVVVNAVSLATSFGISETIIGLTIVSIGTSLPELATSVVAALKKNNDIAVGNIIGSNIFNIFLILGASAMIKPVEFNTQFNTDIAILVAGTLLLFIAMFSGTKKKLDRWEAGILLLIYILYTFYLIQNEIHT